MLNSGDIGHVCCRESRDGSWLCRHDGGIVHYSDAHPASPTTTFIYGVLGCVESVAVIAAPSFGGVLTQSLGWRWCFWINLPIGGITLLTTMFLFSNPKPSDTSIPFKQKLVELDPISNLLFIPALTSLFIALSWAGTKFAWDSG